MFNNGNTEKIQQKLALLPTNSGVYVMLDNENKVIYVGKAKNLKNRVRQYFHSSVKTDKVMAMVNNIADFYYIMTANEIDALSLENNFIKKYKPRYNILLKDDKTYPYIKVSLKEKFPNFIITRKIRKDGSKYFGPFMGGVSVREILEIIQLAFLVRPCNIILGVKPKKECLNYHIKKCLAPCNGKITEKEYKDKVDGAIDFLSGNDEKVEKILNEKMQLFAENEEFEIALEYREKLAMLKIIKEKKVTSLNSLINADIIAFESNSIYIAVNVLITRKGRMQGGKYFALKASYSSDSEALTTFITQFYLNNEIPDEIITHCYAECDLLESYFKEKYTKSVNILCPKQGIRYQLLEMASKNAMEHLEKQIDKIKHKDDMTKLACERLKNTLQLKKYPRRMECYDISNISGIDKVGSMVVFIDGEADKNSYRRFKIKTVEGADDFKSLQEVLTRRLYKINSEEEDRFPKPDLIIIDGGKGQLSSVKEIFDSLNIQDIELISLAKREEEIFTIYTNQPVVLEKSDYALRMLQRIRDEAHRFAITFHRSLRSKRSLSSVLTEIEGIGEKKRKALLDAFKSIDNILNANVEELSKVEGIGKKRAEQIKQYFKEGLK
jgi:excinuclease ABC subunit C